MTDEVQKIREEVQRLQNELIQEKKKGFGSDADDACILELQNVLTYIDSLQEEPVSESIDFEKELYKAFGQVKDFTLGMRIAKWFYDMGKNSQEPVSEELEEAAGKYAQEAYSHPVDRNVGNADFIVGAKWQKQQMMKDAIECPIILSDKFYFIEDEEKCSEIIEALGCKHGDKVKLIIIKEG